MAGRGTGERCEIAVLRPSGRQVPGSADQDLKIVAVERPRGVSAASVFLRREACCGTNYLKARLSAFHLPLFSSREVK
jgi:hypothetical protein